MLQTLIGAAAAILGGLLAAAWQTYRADDVALRIRQRERHEAALLEMYAEVSDAYHELSGFYGSAWQDVLMGRRSPDSPQSTDECERVRVAASAALGRWDGVSTGVISDQPIMESIAELHRTIAMRLWRDGTVAYSQPVPIDGAVPLAQFQVDVEAVFVAMSNLPKVVRDHAL